MITYSTKLRSIPHPLVLRGWKGTKFIRLLSKYFITVNQLYIADDVKTAKKADEQRHTKIAESLKIRYKKYKDEFRDTLLKYELMKTGSLAIDSQLMNYETVLSSLFKAECISVKNTVNSVIYTLRLKESKDEFVYILNDNRGLEPTGRIQLSKYDYWDLKLPSLSISGASGSGKSRVAYYIINQMLRETSAENIFICDPKADELAVYSRQIFKLKQVYTEKEDILRVMQRVNQLMIERYNIRQNHDITKDGKMVEFEPVFVVFDELSAFQAMLSKKPDKDTKEKEADVFNSLFKQLAVKIRACNIHFLIISQQLNVQNLGGSTELREQMSIKIAMGNITSENYKMNFNENKDKSQILTKDSVGSGYIQVEGQEVKNYQAPMIYTEYEYR